MTGPLASIRSQQHDRWMRRALEVAANAGHGGHEPAANAGHGGHEPAGSADVEDGGGEAPAGSAEVPVGAVVYGPDGSELAASHNERERTGDPTAHAEVVALRRAAHAIGHWRLDGCTLVVTLEPCSMCAGALVLARITTLVFGAWEPKTGAVGSLFDVVRDQRLTHRPEVYPGVRAAECAALLRGFFTDRR